MENIRYYNNIIKKIQGEYKDRYVYRISFNIEFK